MKTVYRITILIVATALFSCNNDPGTTKEANDKSHTEDEKAKTSSSKEEQVDKKQDENPFQKAYEKLQKGIKEKDALLLNGMIYPENGTFIIEKGGAVPYFVLVKDFGNYRSFSEGKPFFELSADSLPNYHEAALPKIDCDNPPSFFTKEGTFMQKENRLLPTEIWKYAGLQEKMEEKVEKMVNSISVTVVNTNGFTYYFSKFEGKWYLSFIDMREPCQA